MRFDREEKFRGKELERGRKRKRVTGEDRRRRERWAGGERGEERWRGMEIME